MDLKKTWVTPTLSNLNGHQTVLTGMTITPSYVECGLNITAGNPVIDSAASAAIVAAAAPLLASQCDGIVNSNAEGVTVTVMYTLPATGVGCTGTMCYPSNASGQTGVFDCATITALNFTFGFACS